ncbi:MAG: hypothetical protein ABI972_27580 [Acidobacteriota bacterium]
MRVIAFELLLAALAVAESSTPGAVLQRTGARVNEFWERFSAVTCTETVSQRKLEQSGKAIVQKTSTFDYLILLQMNGDDLMVEESRVLQGKPGKETDRALLTTSGFSTLLLIFHPIFQPSFEFRQMLDEELGGRRYLKFAFTHIAGRRTPSVLQLRSRTYPIEWQGIAWIDAESYSVARIQAALRGPMTDVGMERLTSDVRYSPVALRGGGESPWLPATALIEAATLRQRWQNQHQFTRYREFVVDTDVKVEAPK